MCFLMGEKTAAAREPLSQEKARELPPVGLVSGLTEEKQEGHA
jgi:hypothetical protein